jgi:Tic22-like family
MLLLLFLQRTLFILWATSSTILLTLAAGVHHHQHLYSSNRVAFMTVDTQSPHMKCHKNNNKTKNDRHNQRVSGAIRVVPFTLFNDYDCNGAKSTASKNRCDTEVPRRRFWQSSVGSLSLLWTLFEPRIAHGTTTPIPTTTTVPNKELSVDYVAHLLHGIPTFTIVDTEGVPYMVVGEDARVTGYFFTTYDEASRILSVASRSADVAIRQSLQQYHRSPSTTTTTTSSSSTANTEIITTNPWKVARISTIPLDVAVTLALKAGSGNIRNYFQVAPAATDIIDALDITGKEDLPEGKVPLFYYTDFTIGTSIPLYFQKDQLIKEYRKEHPTTIPQELPPIQVTELFAVLTAMVQPSSSSSVSVSEHRSDLQNIILVAPTGSPQRAVECQRKNAKQSPFVLGQRNIIL